jgi:hypothetical protein
MNIILVNTVFFYFLFGLVTATLGFWYARGELKGQRKLTLVGLFLFCIVAWVYINIASIAMQLKKRGLKNGST